MAAAATAAAVERTVLPPIREQVILPTVAPKPAPAPASVPVPVPQPEEPEQIVIPAMPQEIPWRFVGELYNSYILVEQGEEAYLIDKHAAHERILFEKLKKNQEAITGQTLLQPITCRLGPDICGELLANRSLLEELGFDVDDFGDGTLVVRQIPMDLSPEEAKETLETMAEDLLRGRREDRNSIRDELLHTVACKAAIKAGWKNDERELLALIKTVMADESLKYCPHGRPICVTLSKKQLEKQFKRS